MKKRLKGSLGKALPIVAVSNLRSLSVGSIKYAPGAQWRLYKIFMSACVWACAVFYDTSNYLSTVYIQQAWTWKFCWHTINIITKSIKNLLFFHTNNMVEQEHNFLKRSLNNQVIYKDSSHLYLFAYSTSNVFETSHSSQSMKQTKPWAKMGYLELFMFLIQG